MEFKGDFVCLLEVRVFWDWLVLSIERVLIFFRYILKWLFRNIRDVFIGFRYLGDNWRES